MILKHALTPPDNNRLAHLCGSLDEHLREIEAALGVKLSHRAELFRVEGPKAAAQRCVQLLDTLYEKARRSIPPESLQPTSEAQTGGEASEDAMETFGPPAPPAPQGDNDDAPQRDEDDGDDVLWHAAE